MTTGAKERWATNARRGCTNASLFSDCKALLATMAPGRANTSSAVVSAMSVRRSIH
jgi:hypothetical protein